MFKCKNAHAKKAIYGHFFQCESNLLHFYHPKDNVEEQLRVPLITPHPLYPVVMCQKIVYIGLISKSAA